MIPLRAAASVLLVVALSACSGPDGTAAGTASPKPSPSASHPQPPPRVEIALRPYLSGFSAPLLVTHAGDGSERLFVVEQGGRIVVVDDQRRTTFLDIADRISAGGERGLLGLAFHPSFRSNGRLFVNYTDIRGDTVVAEFRARGTTADPESERVLLTIEQPYPNHNGGHLAFGPDGYLYIGTGDGGSGGDPHGNGQSLDTLLGKLLRIDVDGASGGPAYAIPPDNPFADGGGRPEIWAYGLRNPWRFSFDPKGGDIWIGDVGQSAVEEIDRAPAGDAGLNYGWNLMEGDRCFTDDCDPSGLVLPVATYSHERGCSVVGGYVYRGAVRPALQGTYLFSDYCSGIIWRLDADAADPDAKPVIESGRNISSFGIDEDGELYVTDIGSGDILKVVTRTR